MKKYETPEISVEEISAQDIIATTYTEGGENTVDWLDGWASAINDVNTPG